MFTGIGIVVAGEQDGGVLLPRAKEQYHIHAEVLPIRHFYRLDISFAYL
jgi:hypothetical protein